MCHKYFIANNSKIDAPYIGINKIKERREMSPDGSMNLCKVENLRMSTKN